MSSSLPPEGQEALPAPALGTYPAEAATVQIWADERDVERIRAHAWDVWASITSKTGQARTPVWETWYSGHELFEMDPTDGRRRFPDFENPSQFFHSRQPERPIEVSERVTAFNRYSPGLADEIRSRGFNRSTTLDAINATFDARQTPVADRKVSTSEGLVDARQIALKPVFQIVDGDGPTAIPYWAGNSPAATTDPENPEPATWKQCIAIDPSGTHAPGERIEMPCNGAPAVLEVRSWEDFYSIRLTKAQAEDFSKFAIGSTDDVGAGNRTASEALAEVIRPGNLALLVAMHVTTKEIVDWTWQTFWWSPEPLDGVFGAGRPEWVEGVWRNYNLATAYYMVEELGESNSDPLVAYNPYLETNLRGEFSTEEGAVVEWTGVTSNCMSCHRLAARKNNEDQDPACHSVLKNACGPDYRDQGFIDPADEYIFGGYTKVDFLWSLMMRPR